MMQKRSVANNDNAANRRIASLENLPKSNFFRIYYSSTVRDTKLFSLPKFAYMGIMDEPL